MLNIGCNFQKLHLVIQKDPFGEQEDTEATPAGWSDFEAKLFGGMGGPV